jgi:hypothetical protein
MLSSGVKLPGLEADYLDPSCADVKNEWSCTSPPFLRILYRETFLYT